MVKLLHVGKARISLRPFGKWGWVGLVLVVGLVVEGAVLADPPEYSKGVCTVDVEFDEESGKPEPVTSCVHTERQGSSYRPSISTLHVQIASNGCFYMGTRFTNWVFLGLDDDGRLEYGWSPNGRPGGHHVVGTASPCSWRRVEREEIEGYVWSEIGNYAHRSPQVSFDPPVPLGVVGIETFVALSTPSPWTFSSTSPYIGRSLRAEVKVREVRMDWDDGPTQVFSGTDLTQLTGYASGVASHTYQTKSCDAPGRRCRDEPGAYQVETSFVWSGWYRLGGRKYTLSIPNSSSTDNYPVSELIPLVVG